MSIFINQHTQVIVQGITGHQGAFHTKLMKEYGTQIVAGVTPGKEGKEVEGVPVFNTVTDALNTHTATWSVIFVPAPHAKAAAFEALDAGLNCIIITEHLPVHDMLAIHEKAQEKNLQVIGPNCPGLITPGEAKIGIMPGRFFKKGPIGVISRSGTLTYKIVRYLTEANLGQSTVVGIGGDPINGTSIIDCLDHFEKDPETEKILLIGEIGGNAEEHAAAYIKANITKPVIAYIAGKTAPPGKTMGHAGALISGTSGTYEAKVKALEGNGVTVAPIPSKVVDLLS